ncbi:iron ABC transporter permease [Undibacterium amnicola]|uniref:Iron ABC transporter permease n=2 Tax=Undibacterium amnicola TaxID=1834038 RepID=A0ABR6XN53_9BURK|nr:iron ABC transporter permease [Undibacterium amnicola]
MVTGYDIQATHESHASPVPRQRGKLLFMLMALLLLSAALIVLGLGVGSNGWESLLSMWQQSLSMQIVWDIRLPRTLGAWAAGALLGLSGAVAQGLFRNPLADPYLLGSASGASLGVATALVAFGGSPFATAWVVRMGLTGAAFCGAVLAVFLTLLLARGVQHTLRLLLAGVIVGVVLGALGSLVTMMRPDIVQAMQAFMLGSTGYVGWSSCGLMLLVCLICLVISLALSQVLDGLSLGEATATSLGLPLPQMRMALVFIIALSAGTAVAQTGLIVFVGLAAPHLVRSMLKTTHAGLIALSSLAGGVLLSAADILSRWMIAPQELPVGVVTAILGGAYLLRLMHKQRRMEGH